MAQKDRIRAAPLSDASLGIRLWFYPTPEAAVKVEPIARYVSGRAQKPPMSTVHVLTVTDLETEDSWTGTCSNGSSRPLHVERSTQILQTIPGEILQNPIEPCPPVADQRVNQLRLDAPIIDIQLEAVDIGAKLVTGKCGKDGSLRRHAADFLAFPHRGRRPTNISWRPGSTSG